MGISTEKETEVRKQDCHTCFKTIETKQVRGSVPIPSLIPILGTIGELWKVTSKSQPANRVCISYPKYNPNAIRCDRNSLNKTVKCNCCLWCGIIGDFSFLPYFLGGRFIYLFTYLLNVYEWVLAADRRQYYKWCKPQCHHNVGSRTWDS